MLPIRLAISLVVDLAISAQRSPIGRVPRVTFLTTCLRARSTSYVPLEGLDDEELLSEPVGRVLRVTFLWIGGMQIHSSSILEFRNSIVGPDTFVGNVLGYPVEGRILGLNPIGRVRRVTHPWDGLD